MRSCLFLLIFFALTLSCEKSSQNNESNGTQNTIHDSFETEVRPKYKLSYSAFLKEMRSGKLDQKRFFQFINEDVPHYWIGTKWSFQGITRIPKTGNIACGYFVTNTLSDYGFRIRRSYLAQQASSMMIKEICDKSSIRYFSEVNQLLDYIAKGYKQEIFIVGLDFHTGFIVKDDEKYYFLHSNYIEKEGVVKELVRVSKALNVSKSFMIGSVTKNSNLFK